MRKFINKIHGFLTKKKGIVIVIILIGIIGAVYSLWPKNDTEINITGDVKNSLIAPNSINPILIINENKQIPYTYRIEILESKLSQENWEERYNIKFILPNNKEAFLPKMEEKKKYVLAFTNEDCSDIMISEAYQISDNFDESSVCFTKRIFCGDWDDSRSDKIEKLKNEGKIREALEYIGYYVPTEKAEDDLDSCIVFKEE